MTELEAAAPPRVPARGTRPRNRRAMIIAAAAELFAARGYHQVGMSDLADAVGIGASALYRHFRSKDDLLAAVVEQSLHSARELIVRLDDGRTPAPVLAGRALDQRHLGALWQRDSRTLRATDRAALRAEVRGAAAGLRRRVRARHPELPAASADLLAWSGLAVLTSPAFHHVELPRPGYDELLADLLAAALDARLPVPPARVAQPPRPERPAHVAQPRRLAPASRREALLTEATRLFATHGFARVGVEDIAAAVGIAGPSVYHYWPSKVDLLAAALRRGAAALALEVAGAYRLSRDPAEALGRLCRSYVTLAHTHPEIFGVLITEIGHLPATDRAAMHDAQRDLVGEWTQLLLLTHPAIDPVAARVRVHAALSIAHDTARVPHLQGDPASADAVEAVCRSVLLIAEPG